MSLRRIERELRLAIRRGRRPDLEAGLERVGWTDDGTTLYVHIFARPEWPLVPEGDAFVLATDDRDKLQSCAAMREFLEEARLYLHDETDKVLRWLEGR
jgi:hypothetical protein